MPSAPICEVWKPVVGYEDLYEVSNLGRVRSHGRSVTGFRGSVYWKDGRVLKQSNLPCSSGNYKVVSLSREGVDEQFLVHVLVLEAFVGPRPRGMDCCHFPDRDPSNNSLSNLRWDTRKGNFSDKIEHGTDMRGEKSPVHKLSNEQVKEIRGRYERGEKQIVLAEDYEVSQSYTSRLLRNQKRLYG